MSSPARARRRACLTGGAALAVTALVVPTAVAGSSSGSLPNGAALTVGVTSPVDGDSFLVPEGASTVDVPLSGTASIATGAPSTSWIYVVDLSFSTMSESWAEGYSLSRVFWMFLVVLFLTALLNIFGGHLLAGRRLHDRLPAATPGRGRSSSSPCCWSSC